MADPDIYDRDFTSQDDDLFRPFLQSPLRTGVRRKEIWRVRSQVWIAFFGGSLALTAIAYLNAKRLNASPAQQRNVLLLGSAAFLLTVVAAYTFGQATGTDQLRPGVMETMTGRARYAGFEQSRTPAD